MKLTINNLHKLSDGLNWQVRPLRRFGVRKRATPDGQVLIHLSDVIAISEIEGKIWGYCDGTRNLLDLWFVSKKLLTDVDDEAVLSKLVKTIRKFESKYFINLSPSD